MSRYTITARASVAGLHFWPEAPKPRAYLGSPHRHQFIARACVVVNHDNRDVEFHDLGDWIERALRTLGEPYRSGSILMDFGAQSCERLADGIALWLVGRNLEPVWVSVSEDDEFTATWEA